MIPQVWSQKFRQDRRQPGKMQNVDAGKYRYIVNTGIIFKNLQNLIICVQNSLKGHFSILFLLPCQLVNLS